jgi:hypothetical protein
MARDILLELKRNKLLSSIAKAVTSGLRRPHSQTITRPL